MAKELTTEQLEELYAAMVTQKVSQAVLDGFRRSHGLPMPERPAPTIITRRVPAPTLRPRRAPKKATPTTKDPVAQARGRFDLLEFEETND